MNPLMITLCGGLLAGALQAAQPAVAEMPAEATRNHLLTNATLQADHGEAVLPPASRDQREGCDLAFPLACNAVYNGSSADSQNGDMWTAYCFSGESAPEIIHVLDHPGGLLNLTLNSTDSEQLDLILLGSCDPADCLAMPWLIGSSESISGEYDFLLPICLDMPWLIGSSESISGEYDAGTYYVIVDAYNWNGQPFTFELDVTCPGELDPCEFALPLNCGETVNGSSADSQNGNLWSDYCYSSESGPEVLYALDHPGGLLSLELDSQDSGQLDLILLGSCDPADCLAMPWQIGSSETISGVWPAGRYFVVVDAFQWDGQPFTFTLRADCLGEDALCHHESTGLLLTLPDPMGSALSYLQLFIPEADATLQSVLLHVDTDSEPQHDGTLSLAVYEPAPGDYPGSLAGSLDFDAGALGDGYMELDMTPLGYQIQAFQDYVIRVDFAPAGMDDRLGFFAGSPGGYEEYSSFYNGESYDNWWGNGEEFFDELNLCVTTSQPCEAVELTIETVGTSAVLSWTPVAGTLRITNGMEAYEEGALLVEVDAMDGSYTHTGGVTLGRRFYQALHLCD